MFTLSAMLITKTEVASIRFTPGDLRAIRGALPRAEPSDWMREILIFVASSSFGVEKEVKITIRSQAQLQRKIDYHVAAVERAHKLFYDSDKDAVWGKLRDVYAIARAANGPIDYYYVTEKMGMPHDAYHHWRCATRLGWLVRRGYLRDAGYGCAADRPPYRRSWTKGCRLFVAVPPEKIPIVQKRIKRAVDRMLAAVAPTSYLANEVPACLAKRIGPMPYLGAANNNRALHDRNAEMIRLRIGGEMSLKQIGDKFGITRERVRQIVERAVTGKQAASNTWQHRDAPANKSSGEYLTVVINHKREYIHRLVLRAFVGPAKPKQKRGISTVIQRAQRAIQSRMEYPRRKSRR